MRVPNNLPYILYFLTFLLPIPRSYSNTPDPESNPNFQLRQQVQSYLDEGDNSQYGPISSWDTSQVTDMSKLFFEPMENADSSNYWSYFHYNSYYSNIFEEFTADLSQWDVSNVTNMSHMFRLTRMFTSDLSNWDVSNVVNMNGMFWRSSSFNSDISKWNVSKVTSMNSMFEDAKLFNSDISNWNLQKVTNLSWMLYGTSSFHQKLCWNLITFHIGSMMSNSPGRLLAYPECQAGDSTGDPFQMVSHVSSTPKWCLSSFDISINSPLSLELCSKEPTHNSQFWVVDTLGRIRNYGNSNLCISHENTTVRLQKCTEIKESFSRWIYSFNGKRILNVKNGEKGFQVIKLKSNIYRVKLFKYGNEPAKVRESWDLEYLKGGVWDVPTMTNFKLVFSVGDFQCLVPKNYRVKSGVTIAVRRCKNWKTFQWFMDPEGKIHNQNDPSICISYHKKDIELDSCEDNKNTQKWAYNAWNKKLVPLKREGFSVTVVNMNLNNQFVKLKRESNSPQAQMWEIDPI